ncbi:MAG: molybdopterin-dependent oxidoreductase, partial [Pseudomonadota bacterium]
MTINPDDIAPVAGNGLLGRRFFLKASAAGGLGLLSAEAIAIDRPPWMRGEGVIVSEASAPSLHEDHVERVGVRSVPGGPGSGSSRTPLEYLDGLITPSRLHFERHHSGIPAIDPAQHRLFIYGLVERPLSFSIESLLRYPRVSRIQFLECSGNSGAMIASRPPQRTCSELHGLVS